mgnify:CR=1 FL=1
MNKCCWPDGMIVKPDGIHELDPCIYEVVEVHHNVTVEVFRCKNCGHVELSWYRQENTESEKVVFDD